MYGVVWYGMVWHGMVWYGMVWYGTVRYDTVRYGTVRYGMVGYGIIWYNMVWYGMIRCSVVQWGVMWCFVVSGSKYYPYKNKYICCPRPLNVSGRSWTEFNLILIFFTYVSIKSAAPGSFSSSSSSSFSISLNESGLFRNRKITELKIDLVFSANYSAVLRNLSYFNVCTELCSSIQICVTIKKIVLDANAARYETLERR